MSTTKPTLPKPETTFDKAVRENLEIITGRRGDKIKLVDLTGLTGNDLILAEKINALLGVLQ